MAVAIKLFRKTSLTVNTFPLLELIVHFLNVLLDVAALPERSVAALNRAFEGLVFRVGTHVIEEFGPVGHDVMATASKFALEESLADLVAVIAGEAKDGKLIGA